MTDNTMNTQGGPMQPQVQPMQAPLASAHGMVRQPNLIRNPGQLPQPKGEAKLG